MWSNIQLSVMVMGLIVAFGILIHETIKGQRSRPVAVVVSPPTEPVVGPVADAGVPTVAAWNSDDCGGGDFVLDVGSFSVYQLELPNGWERDVAAGVVDEFGVQMLVTKAKVSKLEQDTLIEPLAPLPDMPDVAELQKELFSQFALPASMLRVAPKASGEPVEQVIDGKVVLTVSTDDPGRSWFTCDECRSEALATGEDECPWCGGMFCETCSPLGEHAGCRAS